MSDLYYIDEDEEIKAKIKTSIKYKIIMSVLIIIVMTFFSLLIYPTLYKYEKIIITNEYDTKHTYVVKINRITQDVRYLTDEGWLSHVGFRAYIRSQDYEDEDIE